MKPKLRLPDMADSGRRAFRLSILPDAPLRAKVNGELVQVDNLSATGMAFTTEALFTLQYYPARLKFRTGKQIHQINCTLRLVRKSGTLWCADFSELPAREQRLLSEFITWYQAEQIRHRNKNS
ncbi:PilZ domain-containing protein [Marinobacterium weihaiense]|uniref:PilZ domain-containing protein n=1 Tax=Marinobacterium weihaiense TaxID=2851016 RepID=A0ABS6M9T0_9GAMM|nr:PilZ domain-containing protein [Marinobacterium weihaiense]MBV0933036.1 PilZ domain-containing protein [Marinobacterium weihaiense]